MPRKSIIAGAWSCLAFTIFATLSPIDLRPVIAGGFFTMLERFGAYLVLGLLLYLAYPRYLTFVCIMVFGSAVTLELLQNFVPDRDPRLLDAMEKLLAGIAGIVLGISQSSFWLRLIPGNDRPQRD